MSTLREMVAGVVTRRRLRRRFPQCVLHGDVDVSDDSILGPNVVLFTNTAIIGSRIGASTYIQTRSGVYNAEIGPFCSIAAAVTIGLAAHPTSMVSTSPVFYDNRQPLPRFFVDRPTFENNLPRTTIGADVWIGQGALLKAGISVGVGAVIGAGAVVTKDVAPYQIVGGNPARLIRERFPEAVAQQLLRARWWELDDATLRELSPTFGNPIAFLAALDAKKDR